TIKLHAGGGATHRHRNISAPNGVAFLRPWERNGISLEVRGGIIVSGARHTYVLGHHGLALFLELFAEDVFQSLESDSHHVKSGADRNRVLCDFVPGDVR